MNVEAGESKKDSADETLKVTCPCSMPHHHIIKIDGTFLRFPLDHHHRHRSDLEGLELERRMPRWIPGAVVPKFGQRGELTSAVRSSSLLLC